MNCAASAVLKSQKANHSVLFALGRGKNQVLNQRTEWIRDTWFTPLGNAQSKMSLSLFMHNSRNLTDELLRGQFVDDNNPDDDCDEYGCYRRGEKWYSYVTKKTLDKSPYENN
jgi:hypothetical protein